MAPKMRIETDASTAGPTPVVGTTAGVAVPTSAPKPRIVASSTASDSGQVPPVKTSSVSAPEPASSVAAVASTSSVAPKPRIIASSTVTNAAQAAPAKESAPQVDAAPVSNAFVADDSWDFSWEDDAYREPEARTQVKDEASRQDVKTAPAAEPARKHESLAGWVRKTFPGHVYAVWGALIALIIALLIFLIGFWRVLLIILLVLIGIALGQVLDGDPKLIRAVRSLFPDDSDR